MSENDDKYDDPNEPSEVELDEAAEALAFPDIEGADADVVAEEQTESDPLTEMQSERDALEDKLRRTMADYQNFAKRAAQNVVVARQQAVIEIAKQMVSVLDHFDHALAADPETTSAADLLKGVGIVHEELLRTLAGFGVQRLDVEPGELFDPNKHEALMRQPDTGIEPDHITAQLQPGYMIEDMTIRPAKVSIAE
jgi:molecular chaperone GrpE